MGLALGLVDQEETLRRPARHPRPFNQQTPTALDCRYMYVRGPLTATFWKTAAFIAMEINNMKSYVNTQLRHKIQRSS